MSGAQYDAPYELKDADLSLVEMRDGTPHCRIHGAMNKLTGGGIWRCVASYRVEHRPGDPPQGRVIENVCRAGCVVLPEGR